jgi:hypothetical protein
MVIGRLLPGRVQAELRAPDGSGIIVRTCSRHSYLEHHVPSTSTTAETVAGAHTLLSQRNRGGALADPAAWNEVLETILNHRSVRGFLPRELRVGTLDLLVAAAQSASTSPHSPR